jgi:hypothetical protein
LGRGFPEIFEGINEQIQFSLEVFELGRLHAANIDVGDYQAGRPLSSGVLLRHLAADEDHVFSDALPHRWDSIQRLLGEPAPERGDSGQ